MSWPIFNFGQLVSVSRLDFIITLKSRSARFTHVLSTELVEGVCVGLRLQTTSSIPINQIWPILALSSSLLSTSMVLFGIRVLMVSHYFVRMTPLTILGTVCYSSSDSYIHLLSIPSLAWLAGDKCSTGKQSYDVWVAFEFPSFVTFSGTPVSIPTGSLTIKSKSVGFIGLKEESATDGTPILAGLEPQQVIYAIPSLRASILTNIHGLVVHYPSGWHQSISNQARPNRFPPCF